MKEIGGKSAVRLGVSPNCNFSSRALSTFSLLLRPAITLHTYARPQPCSRATAE